MNRKLKKILEEIGIILGATGLVPLILSPFGIHTFIISVISAFLFFVILTMYHQDFLNSSVKSGALIIGVLLIFAITSILIHEFYIISPFKLKFEKSNDFLSLEIGNKIKSSKREIWFFGQSFHISAGDRREELINRLEHGVNVRYLVIDPRNKKVVNLIAEDYNSTYQATLNELKSSLSHLVNLQKKLKESNSLLKGDIEIRLINSQPYFRGYFFDPKEKINSAYIVPYMNAYYSSEIPGYLFDKFDKKSVPNKYFSSVCREWNKSKAVKYNDIVEISNL